MKVTFQNRVEAFIYDVITGLMRCLPFAFVSGLGAALVKTLGPLTSKKHIVETGLRTAFPEKSDTEIKALMRAQWDNLGRTFAEFPLTDRLKPFEENSRIDIVGLEHFEANQPAILISGHFANWEIMATVLTQSDHIVRITYRKVNNPLIDARVRKQREAYGTKFLVKKSTHAGGRELVQALKDGESIAILNDQKFNTGVEVPFFGEPAMTAPGAVRLALKTGHPLLPMIVTRNKSRFTVTFYPPIELEKTGSRDADTMSGVKRVVAFTEDRIRENPAQWFWVHRRWPKALYRKEKR
jgi:KDO2-lipid IV(A) lauroyltransferase